MVLLSKIEETLVIDGRRVELGVNRYPGVVHPAGYVYLKEFRQDPFPIFVYEVEGVELEKSIFMIHGENTTVIQYGLRGAGPKTCTLELRPLIAFRDYHSTTHENGALNPALEISAGSRSDRAIRRRGSDALPRTPTATCARPATGIAISNTTGNGSVAWTSARISSSPLSSRSIWGEIRSRRWSRRSSRQASMSGRRARRRLRGEKRLQQSTTSSSAS